MFPTKKINFKSKAAPDSNAPNSKPETSNSTSGAFKTKFLFTSSKQKGKVIVPLKGFESEFKKPSEQSTELIKGFDGNKVVSAENKKKEEPLVIPFRGNSEGWRRKRGVNYIPKSGPEDKKDIITVEQAQVADPSTYGLQLSKRVKCEEVGLDIEESSSLNPLPAESKIPLSLEEEAEVALLKAAKGETHTNTQVEIIPLSTSKISRTEAEFFKEDVEARPDECTLEDYERVPVEQFGAALLRGMGWKDGEPIGKKKKQSSLKPVEFMPRERLLGLGAKPRPAFLESDKKRH